MAVSGSESESSAASSSSGGGSATSSELDSGRPMRGAAPMVGDEAELEQLAEGGGLVTWMGLA